jgi:hypothetical protein
VSKATLRLYVDFVVKAGKFDVYRVNSSWNEGTLTYNTQPLPLGGSLTGGAGISITAASWNQFVLIDITTLAQTWVDTPASNKGLALKLVSGSTGNFYFDAKESLLTANGPELEIVLSGPTGPQGDIGPQGLQGATGAQGLQGPPGIDGGPGPTGATGPQGPAGVIWRGAFDCNATYAVGDVVSYQGSSWIIANFPIGGCVQPPFAPWQLLAKQGADGPQGTQGLQGPAGQQGLQGATGLPGPQGPIGPVGPVGPQGPAGFNGIKEFANATLIDPHIWVAPPNVTHVLVEMWGGGGGGGTPYPFCDCPGGGGAYSRSVIAVTPGMAYSIRVGIGGAPVQPGQLAGQDGGDSSMSVLLTGMTLIHAGGGSGNGGGGSPDPLADISRQGIFGNGATGAGGASFGAQFCPGPFGETTGHGGDYFQWGSPGYVLLTW